MAINYGPSSEDSLETSKIQKSSEELRTSVNMENRSQGYVLSASTFLSKGLLQVVTLERNGGKCLGSLLRVLLPSVLQKGRQGRIGQWGELNSNAF